MADEYHDLAQGLRERGNEAYKAGDMDGAIR